MKNEAGYLKPFLSDAATPHTVSAFVDVIRCTETGAAAVAVFTINGVACTVGPGLSEYFRVAPGFVVSWTGAGEVVEMV
ncbi:hypothetical protein [Sphingomonas sp.]|jgi:hypothetical protein|uniref:hypothetical protein n=1 Tax=Sphingomonas sp. TaxID=28214 RepID=UPI00356597B8